jgi:SAM-dependent methyltransferase
MLAPETTITVLLSQAAGGAERLGGRIDFLEPIIDALVHYMVAVGVTEHDCMLIREVAKDIAQLAGSVSQERLAALLTSASAAAMRRETTRKQEDIARLNRAAEAQFHTLATDNLAYLLNKPLNGISEPPILLYRFSVLLAGLELGLHTVLDFGAGSCWVSSMLNRMGCRTIAMDVSITALRCGKRLFELDKRHRMELDPQFIVYDGWTFPMQDGTIDRIICFDALHHVLNKQDVLREMYRVLKWGGKVGFAEPGVEHAQSPQSIQEMDRYGVLESDIDLLEFVQMAERAGFDQIYIKPYPPPGSIHFNVEEYQRFINGKDQVFPLDIIREDLRHNTIIILQKGTAIPESTKPNVLRARLQRGEESPSKVQRGQLYTFRLEVENVGDTIWLATRNNLGGFVWVGAHLYSADHAVLAWSYASGFLTSDIHPGNKQLVDITMTAPQETGIYVVEFDMVCEMISWFGECGSPTLKVQIEVV